jgi:hypothetical protein
VNDGLGDGKGPWLGARIARAVLVAQVRLYQRTLSRVIPPVCRFNPSCSSYMIEAITVHGALRGVAIGMLRILRCNPLCRGGDDPVPPRRPRAARGRPVGEPDRNTETRE